MPIIWNSPMPFQRLIHTNLTYPATISARSGSDQATAVGCKRVLRASQVLFLHDSTLKGGLKMVKLELAAQLTLPDQCCLLELNTMFSPSSIVDYHLEQPLCSWYRVGDRVFGARLHNTLLWRNSNLRTPQTTLAGYDVMLEQGLLFKIKAQMKAFDVITSKEFQRDGDNCGPGFLVGILTAANYISNELINAHLPHTRVDVIKDQLLRLTSLTNTILTDFRF